MKNSFCLGEKEHSIYQCLILRSVHEGTSYLASKDAITTSNKFKRPISVATRSKA